MYFVSVGFPRLRTNSKLSRLGKKNVPMKMKKKKISIDILSVICRFCSDAVLGLSSEVTPINTGFHLGNFDCDSNKIFREILINTWAERDV